MTDTFIRIALPPLFTIALPLQLLLPLFTKSSRLRAASAGHCANARAAQDDDIPLRPYCRVRLVSYVVPSANRCVNQRRQQLPAPHHHRLSYRCLHTRRQPGPATRIRLPGRLLAQGGIVVPHITSRRTRLSACGAFAIRL
jgi:hypothetical protein